MRFMSLSFTAVLLAAGFLLIGCGSGANPTVTPILTPATMPTPAPTPTPTPILDSDGDGLIDTRESELGTNPFQRDSDIDGLDDGQELRVGTDPLFPDTDRDGVVDGDDVLPLEDAKIRVSILKFTDKTDRAFLHGDTNAYFTVIVGDEEPVITPVYKDVQNQAIDPVVVNVPDNVSKVRVVILAQESTSLTNLVSGTVTSMVTQSVIGVPIKVQTNDNIYDISEAGGTGLDAKALLVEVGANDSVEGTGTGTGDEDKFAATVMVKVDHGAY